MNKLILSQASVYRLHQLANKARNLTGVRHRLADEASMLKLIRDCAFSNNHQIKFQLANFIDSLGSDQLQALSAHGIQFGFQQAS